MQSTCEIVAIHGVPCRRWTIETINGIQPDMESYVYTRLLEIDPDFDATDENVYLLDGPNPPSLSDFPRVPDID